MEADIFIRGTACGDPIDGAFKVCPVPCAILQGVVRDLNHASPLVQQSYSASISSARVPQTDQHLARSFRTKLQAENVQVGPHKEEYLHTLIGGSDEKTPVVIMPGYGAGSGFWFRWALLSPQGAYSWERQMLLPGAWQKAGVKQAHEVQSKALTLLQQHAASDLCVPVVHKLNTPSSSQAAPVLEPPQSIQHGCNRTCRSP
jgi:hypothetical protein